MSIGRRGGRRVSGRSAGDRGADRGRPALLGLARTVANVVQVVYAFDVLVDHTDIGSGWASETGASAETGTPQVDRISIPLHRARGAAEGVAAAARRPRPSTSRAGAGAAHRRQAPAGPRPRPSSTATASRSPRASCAIRRWDTISSPGARLATCRPARRRISSSDPADAIVDLVYALGAVPGERHLRDELQDRRRGAQDEGCGRAVPVVGRGWPRASRRG